jgi:YnbE-like lipoprotein
MNDRPMARTRRTTIALAASWAALSGCEPTVRLEAPDRPIEINLNVRIDHEVRVRVDRDLDRAMQENPALFGGSPRRQR